MILSIMALHLTLLSITTLSIVTIIIEKLTPMILSIVTI
jgi:hypothetical protein